MRKTKRIFALILIIVIAAVFFLHKNGYSLSSLVPVSALSTPANSTACYFTRDGNNPEGALINVINSSKKTLYIAIYSITEKDISNAIISAKKRGVDVRVITDCKESESGKQAEIIEQFKAAGITVKVNNHSGIMHEKVTIADGSTVTTGSYNYTVSASKYNDEVLVVIKSSGVANKFLKDFNAMWNKYPSI